MTGNKGRFHICCFGFGLCSILLLQTINTQTAHAAIAWDGGGNSNWWFDPANWSQTGTTFGDLLPPSQDSSGTLVANDAQINIGVGGVWDVTGEGVVYDPDNDPFFANASTLMYTTGSSAQPFVGSDYGPEHIYRLYIGRNVTNGATNLVTIKSGDLVIASTFIVGRSGSTAGNENLGMIIQEGGRLRSPLNSMELGQGETSGWGNGTYDYRGGTAEIDIEGTNGIRVAHGGGNGVAGGTGKFIVHNPGTPGHVRSWRYQSVSYRGNNDGVFTEGADPDGITRGVAITEFHYENGGTRPIQIGQSLSINNGFQTDTGGTASSRLNLVLHEAACEGSGCVPNDLGLFDNDFDLGFGSNGGLVTGSGDLGGMFSSADGTVTYAEGDTVSALFGGVRYDWSISYSGNITWTNADDSVLDTISGTGTGVDVVLMGMGSEVVGIPGDFNGDTKVDGYDFLLWQRNTSVGSLSDWQDNYGTGSLQANVSAVPEPGTFLLAGAVAMGLLGFRRRDA